MAPVTSTIRLFLYNLPTPLPRSLPHYPGTVISEHHRAPQQHPWDRPAYPVQTLFAAEPLALNLTFRTQHRAGHTQSLSKYVSNEWGEMNI